MDHNIVDTYRDSHTTPGKGREYDSHFDYRHRGFMWSREQLILDRVIEKYFQEQEFDHLDFACGTGRILSYLEERTRTSTGVDVSREMLQGAQQKVTCSECIEADITTTNPFGEKRFDLVTAFRFFPNAEDKLRDEVASALAPLLSEDGYLVFNNHKNRYSLTFLTMWLYCKLRGAQLRTTTLNEMEEMISRAGLEVVETHHTGVVPGYEWLMILPRSWYATLESVFSRIGWLRHIALMQVVVCRRKMP